VLFLAFASCFVVDTFTHLEEKAVGNVSAAIVKLSDPSAATAAVTDVLVFAREFEVWVCKTSFFNDLV